MFAPSILRLYCLCLITLLSQVFAFAEFSLFAPKEPVLQSDTIPAVSGTGIDPNKLLSPHEAFVPVIEKIENRHLKIQWIVHPDYYLYRNKIRILAPKDATLTLPDGVLSYDEFFGQQAILGENFSMSVQFNEANFKELIIEAQGCAEAGLCFPPERFTLSIDWPSSLQTSLPSNDTLMGNSSIANNAGNTYVAEQDYLESLLFERALWALPIFLFLGILLSFTPCVLPMIPILSGIIASHHTQQRTYGFILSLIYVLSMALTYTILGLLAAYLGSGLSAWFQHVYVLSIFSLLFVLLALGMFGVITIRTPRLFNRFLHSSEKQRVPLIRVALMGIVSTLIVGPCVAPPLIGILTFIAKSQDYWLGAAALFSLAMGMGLPLILFGASAGHWLPKAGAWMVYVQQSFGFLLLAMAVYFISRVLPWYYESALIGTLSLSFSIWLWFLPIKRLAFKQINLLIAIIIAIYGAHHWWQILNTDTRAPESNSQTLSSRSNFQTIESLSQLNQWLNSNTQQPFMVDFTADWCVTCKEMEKYTFSDSQVQSQLNTFKVLQIDVTANTEAQRQLLKHFSLYGPPAILFFDADGQEMPQYRVMGFMKAELFTDLLDRVSQSNHTSQQ